MTGPALPRAWWPPLRVVARALVAAVVALAVVAGSVVPAQAQTGTGATTTSSGTRTGSAAGTSGRDHAVPPRRTTVDAVEQHLMCITCGEALSRSTASQADDERDQIAEFVRQGRTEQQAIDGMVAIYGEQVLIDPPQAGIRFVRVVVPVAAVLLGAVVALVLARRWRRRRPDAAAIATGAPNPDDASSAPAARSTSDGGPATGSGDAADLDDDDAARLDADLARYR